MTLLCAISTNYLNEFSRILQYPVNTGFLRYFFSKKVSVMTDTFSGLNGHFFRIFYNQNGLFFRKIKN